MVISAPTHSHGTKLYDYLLTFRMEVELVWKANWTATKALFLLNRYLPLFDLVLTYYRELFLYPSAHMLSPTPTGDNGIRIAHNCSSLLRANACTCLVPLL